MSKHEIRPGLGAACTGALLAGCFSTSATIPDDWARPVAMPGDDCPAIDGTFRNAGETYEEYGNGEFSRHGRSLAHILNGGTGHESLELWNRLGSTSEDPARDRFDAITLRLADGRLNVSAADAEGDGRSISLPVDARCRESVLALDVDWGRYAQFPGFDDVDQVGRISLELGRSEDGSLLVRETESGSYFFLFMPVFAYRDAAWTRFEETSATLVAAGSP